MKYNKKNFGNILLIYLKAFRCPN